ncbi:MAG: spermidine synthase-like protein, partial [Polaromonas sp.]|nr:spermidine synthase-like protein [Polaromonas sp.]
DYPLLFERISRSFGGNAVEILTPEKSNCIVFARQGPAISPQALSLQGSLAGLGKAARAQLKPELARMLWQMKNLAAGDGG